ncbi:MAG: Rrf2 family transcriptional regulator [Actinomycetia bacterium]|nr:Rrf2 family transcriptional regulator [Actinomycetes bacterium]
MPVTLGKHGDYAVRAVIDLARHWDGEPRKAREIAASMDIPPDFLKRILAELVAQGLLTSTAGSNGGYRLTRPPEEISLLDVIEPTERLLTPDKCILKGGPCDWSSVCPIHDPWCLAQEAFAEILDSADLAQIAGVDRDIEHDVHEPANPGHGDPTPRRGIRM